MVLLYAKEGQLANRLWQASFFIANALEHRYFLLHLGFAEYCLYFNKNQYFQSNRKNWRIIDFETTSKWDRLLIKYANQSKLYFEKHNRHYPFVREVLFFDFRQDAKGYDIAQKNFLKTVKKSMVLVDGWQFIDANALKKRAQEIRDIFTPNQEFLNRVAQLKQQCYLKYDYVVGVHLRKGDYATFNQGKWLYSDADYCGFLQQIKEFSSFKNKKLGFLLCSDEDVDKGNFEQLSVMTANGNLIEDLYSLSFCDLIIGPPSTYSAWASFYGNIPLLHIAEKNMEITEDKFNVVLNEV